MKKTEWDYALRLGGVTLEGLGLARLAEYMREFAELLGDEAKPVFAGVVKGSVILRAHDAGDRPEGTAVRLRRSPTPDTPSHVPYLRLVKMAQADGARGTVVDRAKRKLVELEMVRVPARQQEFIISDVGQVDGVVVGVEGIDDTAHVRLQDAASGQIIRMQVRDMAVARLAASCFRGDAIRVQVHGTWRRTAEGEWVPHSLYADAIEHVDQGTVLDAFKGLAGVDGIGWASVSAPQADRLLDDLRGDT